MVTRDQLGERYGTAEHRGLAYAVSGAPGWGRKAVRVTDASLLWSQPSLRERTCRPSLGATSYQCDVSLNEGLNVHFRRLHRDCRDVSPVSARPVGPLLAERQATRGALRPVEGHRRGICTAGVLVDGGRWKHVPLMAQHQRNARRAQHEHVHPCSACLSDSSADPITSGASPSHRPRVRWDSGSGGVAFRAEHQKLADRDSAVTYVGEDVRRGVRSEADGHRHVCALVQSLVRQLPDLGVLGLYIGTPDAHDLIR